MTETRAIDRREALFLIAAGGLNALGALMAKPVEGSGAFVKGLYEQANYRITRHELRHVVDIAKPMQIYAGTNLLAKAEGKKGLSIYLKSAGAAFSKVVESSLGGKVVFEEVQPDDTLLKLDVEKELILLGGPVANMLGGTVTGYQYEHLKSGPDLPIFKSNNFRWGYYCGDEEYGSYFGTIEKAKRCEGGLIVERPLYAIVDNKSSANLRRFKKDDNGFLKEEVLLITKTKNPFNDYFSMFIIGGMHGYSIQKFAKEIEENLSELKGKIRESEQYQIYVPVDLEHKKKREIHVTEASLNWDAAKIELL